MSINPKLGHAEAGKLCDRDGSATRGLAAP